MKTKWIFKLINAVAMALIAASAFVLLSVVLTPVGQVPQVLGYSVFRVMTGSMEPEISENAMLLVKKTPPEDIRPGDIISFFSPDPALGGAVNTHRVVRIEKENGRLLFITKGDANPVEDIWPVDASALVGKVVFRSYGLGRAVSLLSNPLVFVGIILLPLLVILLTNLYRAVRLAADIARQEEEAALRQALEELKAKQNQDNGNRPAP